MTAREWGWLEAGAAEAGVVAKAGGFAGRPLEVAEGFAAVEARLREAGPGARGAVSFLAEGERDARVVSVVMGERDRVFWDEQAGGLGGLPAAPQVVKFVLTAGPAVRLSAAGLGAAVAAARAAEAGGAGVLGSLQECVGVVQRLLRGWLYPRGVRPLGPLGSADEQVVGAGGVRQRLVPSPGWAPVGSWDALEAAVEQAGTGASAVVLVSYAGDQEGHALVLHHTTEGLRWADPNGGQATEERPAAVGGAVAGWAAVLRPGRPGGGAGRVDGAGIGRGGFWRGGGAGRPAAAA